MTVCNEEIIAGERFAFGKNWRSFLAVLDEERILQAQTALSNLLRLPSLQGLRFLDIGSGSGLSSLAAHRLGAAVSSFDFDPDSVGCTELLKQRFSSTKANWSVYQGSALDEGFLSALGEFNIVYSWGVLHHTGNLWKAIDLAIARVAPKGLLVLAIYNDQKGKSRLWRKVKRTYCSGIIGKVAVCCTFIPYFALRFVALGLVTGRNFFREHKEIRGMSIFHDWLDWLGGYPFEVASVEQVFQFCTARGFALRNLTTTNGQHGNNEFVFERIGSTDGREGATQCAG